jgi:hypothetical protein
MPKYAQEICGPTLTFSVLALFVVLAARIPAWQPSGKATAGTPIIIINNFRRVGR